MPPTKEAKLPTLGQRVRNLEQDVQGKDEVYWGALGRLESRIRALELPDTPPVLEPEPPATVVEEEMSWGPVSLVGIILLLVIAAAYFYFKR